MFYNLYKALKTAITPIEGVQDIQWFNAQYEGIIHIAPCVLIEFSPLVITRETKLTNQTAITIRLHVVSEVISESDNNVSDAQVEEHEALAHQVLDAVDGLRMPFEDSVTRPLQQTGWTHNHKYNGWMVTLIDLKTKG